MRIHGQGRVAKRKNRCPCARPSCPRSACSLSISLARSRWLAPFLPLSLSQARDASPCHAAGMLCRGGRVQESGGTSSPASFAGAFDSHWELLMARGIREMRTRRFLMSNTARMGLQLVCALQGPLSPSATVCRLRVEMKESSNW